MFTAISIELAEIMPTKRRSVPPWQGRPTWIGDCFINSELENRSSNCQRTI